MSEDRQLSFILESNLYKQKLIYADLSRVLDYLLRSGVGEFRVKILLNKKNIIEEIHQRHKYNGGEGHILYKSNNCVSIRLSGEYGRKNKSKIDGNIFITQHPIYKNVWIAITDSTSDFLKKPFKYFLRTIHPRCASLILTTPQIEQLFISFKKEYEENDIRVKQIGQRSRIRSVGARKSIETDRKWTDLTITEAFSEAREENQWVTDVTIEYGEKNKPAILKVGRFGELIIGGRGKNVFDHFVNIAAKFGEERFNFLNNRQRSKDTNFKSKPFHINFDSAIFSSKDQFQKLSKSLMKIPATSFTPLHRNPYFHAVMVDYKDGSSYEVMIMDKSFITVIPQGRATVRSLQRLCSYIFSDFREGEIVETINYGQ